MTFARKVVTQKENLFHINRTAELLLNVQFASNTDIDAGSDPKMKKMHSIPHCLQTNYFHCAYVFRNTYYSDFSSYLTKRIRDHK